MVVLFSTIMFAQNSTQDVVYLKNGSIIRGIIIEQVPNQTIKIQTMDGNVFVYKIDEVEKMTKEQTKGKKEYSNNNSFSGYRGIIEAGYQIKNGDYGLDRFKFNFINGYQISPYFSFGLGTGIRYYVDEKATLVPVFLDLRTHFLKGNFSPYLSVDFGYSFDATNDFKSVGFLLNPTVGASIKISNKSSLDFGLGYELQRMNFLYLEYNGYIGSYVFYEDPQNCGAISFNIGFSF